MRSAVAEGIRRVALRDCKGPAMDGSPRHPPSRRPATAVDDPFLAIKLTVPALPDWVVARQRIERRIAAGALGPLTVITGPPGAGKTIAAASWATASSRVNPTAWVTLDEYDNGPRVFWTYLVEALRHAGFTYRSGCRPRSAAAPPTWAPSSGWRPRSRHTAPRFRWFSMTSTWRPGARR